MSANSVLVGGVVGIDHIVTPTREGRELLGGSLPFAAMAAARFAEKVHVCAVVGEDFPENESERLRRSGICLTGLERMPGKTFRWSGEYIDNMNERRTLSRELNVLENWHAKLAEEARDCSVIILSCSTGKTHLEMLAQCRAPKLILADTIDIWIRNERKETDEIVSRSDIFVLNESEAFLYADTRNVLEAGEFLLNLGARYVIVKLGEYGSLLFGRQEDGGLRLFRCAAWPLRSVVDPTGAGDAFLGALGGYLAGVDIDRLSFEDIRRGMAYGAVVSSFVCEDFTLKALEKADRDAIEQRFALFRELTSW